MAESREIEFQSLVKQIAGELVAFTEVKEENNSVYFTLAGHRYRTFGYKIHHQESVLFKNSFTDFLSKLEGTPEGIERQQKTNDEVNQEIDDWDKYGPQVLEIAIVQAMLILNDKGLDAFVEFLNNNFFITPEKDGKKLMKFVKQANA